MIQYVPGPHSYDANRKSTHVTHASFLTCPKSYPFHQRFVPKPNSTESPISHVPTNKRHGVYEEETVGHPFIEIY